MLGCAVWSGSVLGVWGRAVARGSSGKEAEMGMVTGAMGR